MPIESAGNLSQLDKSWPLGGDMLNQGDNHLRLIKAVLKAQFPGEEGDGFKVPITATEVELNSLSGVGSPIQTQIDDLKNNLSAPKDTRMTFHQESAPEGWTQDTRYNDYMLRVVSGRGKGVGGSSSPTINKHRHNVPELRLTAAQSGLPSHTHSVDHTVGFDAQHKGTGGRNDYADPPEGVTGSNTARDAAEAHDHGDTDYDTWYPRFTNMIICEKD